MVNKRAFTVRVDEDLHKEIKIKLIRNGESLQGFIIRKMKEELELDTNKK